MISKMRRADIPQHEVMLFVLRIALPAALVWAVIATFAYWKLAERFGWDKLGLEANVSIFAAFTLGGILVVVGLAYLIHTLFRPAKRKLVG
jgi:hypothetical protein